MRKGRKIYVPKIGDRISDIQKECFRIIPKDYRLVAMIMMDDAIRMTDLVDDDESIDLKKNKKYFNATIEGIFSTKLVILSRTWRNIDYLRSAKQALAKCGAIDYFNFDFDDPEHDRCDPDYPEFDTMQKLWMHHSTRDIYVLNPIFSDFSHKSIGFTDYNIDTDISQYNEIPWLLPSDIEEFIIDDRASTQ